MKFQIGDVVMIKSPPVNYGITDPEFYVGQVGIVTARSCGDCQINCLLFCWAVKNREVTFLIPHEHLTLLERPNE